MIIFRFICIVLSSYIDRLAECLKHLLIDLPLLLAYERAELRLYRLCDLPLPLLLPVKQLLLQELPLILHLLGPAHPLHVGVNALLIRVLLVLRLGRRVVEGQLRLLGVGHELVFELLFFFGFFVLLSLLDP